MQTENLKTEIRHDWSEDEALAVYRLPLLDLVFRAAALHRKYHDPSQVQLCSLLSIKTGGCPEDCGYCPQSAHYETPVEKETFLDEQDILASARQAKEEGATRFCMGAAWREVRDGKDFDKVLGVVHEVSKTGLEVCVTLGMLNESQAIRLKEAGLTAYNHNLDTSESFYPKIITTRTYQDRLDTIGHVINAGISVCAGGIIGMGESDLDRSAMLVQLTRLEPHPESVPVNLLVPIPGTPLASAPPLDPLDLVRMIATARILMPRSRVRLSAGRRELSRETQALSFLAGANSIFSGERLLTSPNPPRDQDSELLDALGLKKETVKGERAVVKNQ